VERTVRNKSAIQDTFSFPQRAQNSARVVQSDARNEREIRDGQTVGIRKQQRKMKLITTVSPPLFSAVQSTRCTSRDYVHPKVFTEYDGSQGIRIDRLWRLRSLKERTKRTEAAKAGQYTLQAAGPATHGNTPALHTPSLSILDRRSPMFSHFVSNPIARLNAALRH